jgi:hypothetical protein
MQNVKSKRRTHGALLFDFSFCILHFAFAAAGGVPPPFR